MGAPSPLDRQTDTVSNGCVLGHRVSARRGRVPEASAVEVRGEPDAARGGATGRQLCERHHLTVERVLEDEHLGDGMMIQAVVGARARQDGLRCQESLSGRGHDGGNGSSGGMCSTDLPTVDVRTMVAENLAERTA